MKKITVLSGLLLLAGLAAQAQERVAEYNVRPAVTVRTPLQGDSINFKGDKFTTGNLLKTKVSLDFDGGRYERMVADTAGYVTVAKADKDNLFYLFATNLRAERFMKGKLNVYSPARFEVFVNGESKQVKETAEDSLSQVRPTAVSLRMDPEADYEIVIKLLSSADDKMQPMLKCEFEKEKDFADVACRMAPDMKRRFSLFNTNFGSRASRVSLSPNGKYLLTRYSDNYDVKRSRTRCELTEVKTGRVILPNANEKMNWMPNSNKLYYTVMGEEQNDLVVFDPATMREEVLGGLGGFAGAFSLAKIKEMEDPVLLSGTDGCGTKVKLAIIMDKHDTIGIDAVAMCVNDIACAGGEPLFFLDYIACGKNYPEKIADIVKGVAEGCLQSEAALIGGETAEHPGLMPEDEYDLAGFAVGVCDKKDMITGENLAAGDVLIGMASTGVHSNGFSLVRKVFEKELNKEGLETYYEELGTTLGEALLAPTRIYVKALKAVKNAGVTVKACSHITGGGFYENVPRMLKDGVCAVIKKDSYQIPPIFGMLAKKGDIEEHMMYNTYNMGLGMVLAVDPADVDKTMEAIKAAGDTPYVVGKITDGEKGVTLC